MSWTNETIAELKKLWKQGKSTGEIGKILGVTKNSVVGKVHRLDLDGRPSPIKLKSGEEYVIKKAKPREKPKAAVPAPKSAPAPKTPPKAAPAPKPAAKPAPAPAPKTAVKPAAPAPAPKPAAPVPSYKTVVSEPRKAPEPARAAPVPSRAPSAPRPSLLSKEDSGLFSMGKAEHKPGAKVSVTDLDGHTCRWPVGDPRDEGFHFCGRKIPLGRTYCDEHAAIAYVKAAKK